MMTGGYSKKKLSVCFELGRVEHNFEMKAYNLFYFLCCLAELLPTLHCQVPGFGEKNSIGKTPFPPSSFYPDETWGVNNANDNRWPNRIIPYNFDYTACDLADNITLSRLPKLY